MAILQRDRKRGMDNLAQAVGPLPCGLASNLDPLGVIPAQIAWDLGSGLEMNQGLNPLLRQIQHLVKLRSAKLSFLRRSLDLN